ncbi:MAG TPA: YihY/virulence factor BrkB family protein [Gemmatimonadaceae bacterium]|nr:YihY/virulence factor BrkB family protein [Gemmatimonadaceae bacterium]
MQLGGYRIWPLIRATGKQASSDRITGLAAEAAYHFFFSLFPFLLFATALIGIFVDQRSTINWIMNQMARVVPDQALTLVRGVVADVVLANSKSGFISLGLVLTAWSGSNVFRSLMDTLNLAYDVEEERPFWKRALLSLVAIIVLGALMLIASVVMLGGPQILNWLGTHLHLPSAKVDLWMVLQFPIAFAILVLAFFLIYRFLPNLKQSVRQLLVGSVVATVLWLIVTLLFRLYVTNFGSYNKTYGAIGAVIVVLTWMYLTMLVILVGGELNAELHRGTGAIHPREGAVYAGRVVTSPRRSRSSTPEPAALRASGGEASAGSRME